MMNPIQEREEEEEEKLAGEEEEEEEDHLHNFRQQWKQELQQGGGGGAATAGEEQKNQEREKDEEQEEEDPEDDIHKQARTLFLQGVQYEENGKLFEAIRCYKRAERLVPNIELETFDYTGRNMKKKSPSLAKEEEVKAPVDQANSKKVNEGEIEGLSLRFSRMRSTEQSSLIQMEVETNEIHLGDLPSEVINYILKWVVSKELDLRSLERVAAVCRGLYLAARDQDIWRLACAKVWGKNTTYPTPVCWRQAFLTRPRVHFSGCYLSKISYIREGERSFQDQESYRAWHVVEYHRFIRFLPGGQVAMLTSSNDDPALVAKQLNTKQGCISLGAMMGEYKIVDNVLVAVMKKPVPEKKKTANLGRRGRARREEYVFEVPEQDFHLEFQIRGSNWHTLQWTKYIIVSKYANGREQVDTFDTANVRNYPRLKFSRVGCYHFESTSHL